MAEDRGVFVDYLNRIRKTSSTDGIFDSKASPRIARISMSMAGLKMRSSTSVCMKMSWTVIFISYVKPTTFAVSKGSKTASKGAKKGCGCLRT